jgi:hypothetical protein
MSTKVFWLEPTDLDCISLRRYHNSKYGFGGQILPEEGCPPCPGPMGYHDASNVIDAASPRDESQKHYEGGELSSVPHDDPRWPTHCGCGYAFTENDQWQVNHRKLYRSGLDGSLHTLRDAPAGAMWDASWYRDHGDQWVGPDGMCLLVKLPNGHDWMVDGQASNCTRDQYVEITTAEGHKGRQWGGRTHWCWVRHGDPRTGEVTVDKNGETCSAGAGSILSGNWHGFLTNGYLVP